MKKLFDLLKNDERGLTLVELLAVIVILAIIGGIAFVSVGNIIENSRQDAHIANAIQAISAAELAHASGEEISEEITASTLNTFNDNLVNPFDNADENYDFTIVPDTDGEFTVTSDETECSFNNKTKADLSSQGRDICTN
ncbi:type II secretion system protein [Ornithinibacillus salinisoli]|uniref:Type II secretion system protein n=1 Tax=Ornithinibacillus salinisoli TaxID=1848459 RepID=A0ABW4W3M2_9BACI